MAKLAAVGTHFVLVALQLALVLLVVDRFHLAEWLGLPKLLPIIFIGFVVHAAAPQRFRLPIFLLLTAAGCVAVFSPTRAAWLIGIALGLIGLCHVPVNFWVRVGLVTAAAATLALIHVGKIETSDRIRYVIPILGSIFMFRLVLYLYDLRHERTKISPWQRLAYFFLLPNPVLPLFPVVDYKTFLRTYYQRDALKIYQKGVQWMARGVIHLLLYRLIYYYLVPPYEEIGTLADVALFALTAYLLYLRVSGLFHLSIGILCLFGFDLPETHKRYLLASGFNDYWRRINIYWKDFMTKIVFYPTFMRARKFGHIPGLVISTGVVFFITWLLHSYQQFWLQGAFPLSLVDGLFWGLFGLLVIINTVFEAKRGPVGKLQNLRGGGGTDWDLPAAVRLSVQTAAMFVLMCLLWSMWTSPSLQTWTSVLGSAANQPVTGVLIIFACLAAGIALGTLAQYLHHRGLRFVCTDDTPPWRIGLATAVPMLIVLALWYPAIHQPLNADGLVKSMRGGMLNQRDQRTLERGYYEGLLVPNNMTSALWEAQFGMPKEEDRAARLLDPTRFRPTGDLLFREQLPNVRTEENGKSWSTNRWGMRDRDYEQQKPPGVTRIALIGGSYTMGKRVPDGSNYESLLENKLNASGAGKFEILNFAVDAYSPLEGVLLCRDKIWRFQPDYMFFVDHGSARLRIAERLADRMISGVELEYDYLKSLQWKARAYPGVGRIDAARKVYESGTEALDWCYAEMASSCRTHQIEPVWVMLPRTKENNTQAGLAKQEKRAQRAGMKTIMLEQPYGDYPVREITIARYDFHPNELGHKLIAEKLFDALKANESKLKLGL